MAKSSHQLAETVTIEELVEVVVHFEITFCASDERIRKQLKLFFTFRVSSLLYLGQERKFVFQPLAAAASRAHAVGKGLKMIFPSSSLISWGKGSSSLAWV